ncbi:MAG: polysaccharide pyruvyl transferase family protein [Marinifilaceae bacterium]|jgi:hypothetical protein|nr:polysaccharide pyruvyl transferase family protein [Marinifilaceae bacterium]
MKIGYIGGYWVTNIGNSFYDIGIMHLLKEIVGEDKVFMVPDLASLFWNVKNNYEPIVDLDLDLILFGGPVLGKFLFPYEQILKKINPKVKIGFISAGCSDYTEEEKLKVLDFLKCYMDRISFICTRDSKTYNLYKDSNFPVFDGVCGSMFLNDAVSVPKLNKDYFVFNFSYRTEPYIDIKSNNIELRKKSLFTKFQTSLQGFEIVRTNHFLFTWIKYFLFNRPNIYYSDIPYGYFSIYKNAKTVFSDRVHTCAATLILGNKAMYIKGTKRSHDGRNNLFKRIGVSEIYDKPVALNFEYINKEKEKMVNFLKVQLNKNNEL